MDISVWTLYYAQQLVLMVSSMQLIPSAHSN